MPSTDTSHCDPIWRENVLRDLIRRYLPVVHSRHRNASNEIQYVTTTLSRVCLQLVGFRLTAQEVTDALHTTGHSFFTRDGLLRPDGTAPLSSPARDIFGEVIPDSGPRIDRLRDRIHTNVPHRVVRTMRLTTIPTPSGTADDKCRQIDEMRERLKEWSERWK